jgi:hypothetical protein
MKRILVFISIVSLAFPMLSQTPDTIVNVKKLAKVDTIYMLSRKKVIGDIIKIGSTSISCRLSDSTIKDLERKQIEKIIYRDGKKEIYNQPAIIMINPDQWEAVEVTTDPQKTEGLYKRAVIIAKSAASDRISNMKAAKTSATMRLQKKAANAGAIMVLVTRSEAKGGYGDPPAWEIEGIAYGLEPPEEKKNSDLNIENPN